MLEEKGEVTHKERVVIIPKKDINFMKIIEE